MSKYDYFIKIEQLRRQNLRFAAALLDAIERRKNPNWIRGMIQLQTGENFTREEVENYLMDVCFPDRKAKAVAAYRVAMKEAGEEGEDGPEAPGGLNEAQGATSGPGGATGARRYRVDDEDIFDQLERQLRLMLEEAAANPNSDAAKMLEILAFRQLRLDRTKAEELDFMKFYSEQTRRMQAEARVTAAESQLMKERTNLWKVQDKAEEAVAKADEASAQGRPFDWREAFNQLSAVIGLGQPEPPALPGDSSSEAPACSGEWEEEAG